MTEKGKIDVHCEPSGNEEVICISGSMRFKDLKEKVFQELLKNGWYVRGSECVADESTFPDGYRDYLRDMHMRKITKSDALYVVNKDEYIGKDTEDEIIFAKGIGVSVYFLEENSNKSNNMDKGFNHITEEDIQYAIEHSDDVQEKFNRIDENADKAGESTEDDNVVIGDEKDE